MTSSDSKQRVALVERALREAKRVITEAPISSFADRWGRKPWKTWDEARDGLTLLSQDIDAALEALGSNAAGGAE